MDTSNSQPPVTPVEVTPPEPYRPQFVSVLDPIEPAIAHVRKMLFQPFDLSKWMIIGFCAWLAFLGEGGGGGNGFNFNFPGHHQPMGSEFSQIKDTIMPYLPLIIFGVVSLVVFFLIIGIVLTWIRSRGQFMFVHCIAGNVAEVGVPWRKYSRHGNSLFLFRIVLGLIGFFVVVIPLGIIIFSVYVLSTSGFNPVAVMGLVASIFAFIIVVFLLGLVQKFTTDFVVPIMFTQTASVTAGWRRCLSILGANKARMVLYILFQFVIAIVISIIVTMICLIGCCCCCMSILLFIPYIGTVALLPLFAFKRAYSLFYLRQFGPLFDVFIPQVNIPTAQS